MKLTTHQCARREKEEVCFVNKTPAQLLKYRSSLKSVISKTCLHANPVNFSWCHAVRCQACQCWAGCYRKDEWVAAGPRDQKSTVPVCSCCGCGGDGSVCFPWCTVTA